MSLIIDREVVQGLLGESRDSHAVASDRLLSPFLLEGSQRVAAVVEAASRSDLDTLEFAARGLRIVAARVGAQRLSEHCEFLEIAARADDSGRALALAVELGAQFEAARAALMNYLRKSPARA
jgi:hypothetical protein